MYYMGRDGFTMLAMGFTGKEANEFKFKYIQAFNEMEETIKSVQIPTNPMDALKLMFQAHDEAMQRTDEIDKRVIELEENVSLTPGEYNALSRRVKTRIREICFERTWSLTKEQKSILFKAINTDIHKVSGIKTRTQLKQKHFDIVYDLVNTWAPSYATSIEIKNAKED